MKLVWNEAVYVSSVVLMLCSAAQMDYNNQGRRKI